MVTDHRSTAVHGPVVHVPCPPNMDDAQRELILQKVLKLESVVAATFVGARLRLVLSPTTGSNHATWQAAKNCVEEVLYSQTS